MRHPGPESDGTNTGFQYFSTRRTRAGRRFDYWRSLHPNIDIDVVEKDAHKDFRAELLHYAAPDGTTFGMASHDDVVARFARPHREPVLFSLTLTGSAILTRGTDTAHIISPDNGFLALDSTRPQTTASKRHKHLYLTVPRAKVMSALNDNPDVLSEGFMALPSSGVAELLKSHLLMTAKEGKRLNAQAVATAVTCGVDLALVTLAQELDRDGHASRGGLIETLHTAANRHIQLHLGDGALTTERVAHAVGCSRAHLHGGFTQRDERVGEYLRQRAAASVAPGRQARGASSIRNSRRSGTSVAAKSKAALLITSYLSRRRSGHQGQQR